MELQRKRVNRKQRELLVERLHNNLKMTRGNQADLCVTQYWNDLSRELNQLGFSRSAQRWQHIWNVWVAKARAKARKIRDTTTETGGGPAGENLTEIERKILDVLGSASGEGFVNLKMGLSSTTISNTSPMRTPEVLLTQDVPSVEPGPHPQGVQSLKVRSLRRRMPRRRLRPPVDENLTKALNENSQLLHGSIIQAAQIMADAIRSLGLPNLNSQN